MSIPIVKKNHKSICKNLIKKTQISEKTRSHNIPEKFVNQNQTLQMVRLNLCSDTKHQFVGPNFLLTFYDTCQF